VTFQQSLERELAGPQLAFSGAWPERLKPDPATRISRAEVAHFFMDYSGDASFQVNLLGFYLWKSYLNLS
jgi:hypothetical protein